MRLTRWRLRPSDRGLYYESANPSSSWRDAKTSTRDASRCPIRVVISFREKSHRFNRGPDAIEQEFGIKPDRERCEHEETSSAFFRHRNPYRDALLLVPIRINQHAALLRADFRGRLTKETFLQRAQGERGYEHHSGAGDPHRDRISFPRADQDRDFGGEPAESWDAHGCGRCNHKGKRGEW